MTSTGPGPGPGPTDETTLDDLDAEVIEDLDVDEDAGDVRGGTIVATAGCPAHQ